MANAYDSKIAEEYKNQIESEALDSEESMGEKPHEKTQTLSAFASLKDYIQTYITFNKGGSWHLIKAPERDSEGKKYDCSENCYLNFFGSSKKIPEYYSVPKAVGIILANGNVGQHLTSNDEEISTFLSRDGGFTWMEVN
jgi:hypothetical protein